MSRINQKCDNPDCGKHLNPNEGQYWATGALLCDKCYKELSDRYNIINDELDVDKWEEFERKSDEQKIEEKIEADIEEKIEKKKEQKTKEKEKTKKRKTSLLDF